MKHRRALLENSNTVGLIEQISSVRDLLEQARATSELEKVIAKVRNILAEMGIRNPTFQELRDRAVFEFSSNTTRWELSVTELRGSEYMLELKNKDERDVDNRPTSLNSLESNLRFILNNSNVT